LTTKTDLLSQLTTDQLMEIAIAENIQIRENAEKAEIVRALLKLPMEKIRERIAEYTDQEATKPASAQENKTQTGILEPILESASKLMGKEIGDLVREKILIELNEEKPAKGKHEHRDFGNRMREVVRNLRREELWKPVSSERGPDKEVEDKPETIGITDVLPDRIRTAYEDLDNLLFGGIPKDYAVILTSPSCDERELLIKSFLEAGAKEGQITFYVTVEATEAKALAEQFQSNFYLFICNPQADTIIQSLPNVFKLKGVENLTDINIALTSAFRKLDMSLRAPRRACIEIISDILLQHHAVSIRRWLTALVPELRSRGFTTLAVMNPYMHPSEEVQAILDLFDGEISIYEKETPKGLERFLRIKKMYNQRYLDNELPIRKERLQTKKESPSKDANVS
jgi:KaiC/GvpD/RAD55 family RecA-like ATPase